MGSMETGLPLKRASLLRSSPSAAGRSFFQRPRSRLARFLLFEKVDYLQWICTVAAFFVVVILFQAFLPGSVLEKSTSRSSVVDRGIVKSNFGELDFGDGIRFVPTKLLERFERERKELDSFFKASGRPMRRAGLRKPRLALVVGGLSPDAMQLQMVSIAAALKEIGYDIEVFSFHDGSVRTVWRAIGIQVNILPENMKQGFAIDWLDYSGVLVSSVQAGLVISCLLQDPFKSVPVIWIIQEQSLAIRLSYYAKNGHSGILSQWKQVFSRTNVVVFTNYLLPIMFSAFDVGNYFVIPSSVSEAWKADSFLAVHNHNNLRINSNYSSDDFLIALVGSQFEYSGMWLEKALVLQGLIPLQNEFRSKNYYAYPILKVGILSGKSSNTDNISLETIALHFDYPKGVVQHIGGSGEDCSFLSISDLVIYASFLEEQSFPPVLLWAMSLGKLVVAPDLDMINKYIVDGVNGFLYPKDNVGKLMQVLRRSVSKGELSPLAKQIASLGQRQARNLMVSETIQGYSWLLGNILKFPSETSLPKAIAEIPSKMKEEWQWHLFENLSDLCNQNETSRKYGFLDKLEEWNQTHMEANANTNSRLDESFSSINWEEEKMIETINARKRLEEEELKNRADQPHGTWEEVYRSAKRADKAKNELHESDEKELERTGQPLCIYEPYFGEGTWPFLHNSSLYRGIGLSSKGLKPGAYDIDAPSRLPLLGNPYYRETLGEFGAFFALANRIDRIHKNAWTGFQSWRVGARKESLSKKAEKALLQSIEAQKHGDALYFWVSMDRDPRNPLQQDFWSFCDAINAGNCRFTVSEALRQMYGVPHDWDSLPPMPEIGGTWSVMHSWALPTRSFLEFVMFSRLFVDALDTQMHEQHYRSSYCYLNSGKDRHCLSRVLELLVNVWAYHSARQIIYVNPQTGEMHEQHQLKRRRGKMWIKWFSFSTLKSMDEDLAEESDSDDHPNRPWLWPSTGEVFWQGIYDLERSTRQQQKEKRRQQSKDKIRRLRSRTRQKSLGKYIKPPPEGIAEPTRGS